MPEASADSAEGGGVLQSIASAFTGQPWRAMDDLAEAVDDLICSFDYSYADAAMDTLAMLLFFWSLVALLTLFCVKWLYGKYKKRKGTVTEDATKKTTETDETTVVAKPKSATAEDILQKKSAVTAPLQAAPAKAPGVPATPPALGKGRNSRMSRMSPGPDAQRVVGSRRVGASQVVAPPPPQCSGPDPVAARWTTALLAWLYGDLVVVNDLLQLWIVSMNEFSKKSVEEHGVGVELVRVLGETATPKVSSVFCECDSKDDVTITCDFEATPALQLKAFRQKGDKVEVAHYRVNVNRFRARMNVVCITEKLTGELRCDGWPDVKVALAPVGALRNNTDEAQLQEVISEVVVSALRNTQVMFSLAHYPTCPRMRRVSDTPSRMLPMHYEAMMGQNPLYTSTPIGQHGFDEQLLAGDKRLLVKVVSAKQLGLKVPTGCSMPYCVVEMDDPPQRNQTSVKKDTDAPFWDEHFLFDLSPHTAELLFEIFDKGPSGGNSPVFLGLGIVGVEELLVSPSQRQLITLQSRPLQEDPVSGVLTVEFLFIEGADIPLLEGRPFKLKETLRTVSPTGLTTTTTRTMFKHNDVTMNGTSPLTESALRELDRSPSTATNKSTLIIHSVQRTPKQTKVELTDSGEFIEVEQNRTSVYEDVIDEIDNDVKIEEVLCKLAEEELTATPLTRGEDKEKRVTLNTNKNKVLDEKTNGGSIAVDSVAGAKLTIAGEKEPGDVHQNPVPEMNGQPPERIPRQKKRRDFFGTIKRRLNRSRTRAKSVDVQDSGSEDQLHGRSISADRNNLSENSLSVPSPTRIGNTSGLSSTNSPAQSGDESRTSRRSSISEMSGISGASTRTYLHEASTLVLETVDNGVRKHFLVPLSIAQRSRWRRKGTKLHIFNDHTFVAKHLAGGIVCEVCHKNIARRIGKQGYECRDCLMKCHKHCHVRVLDTCQSSTIHTIELQYITSPFTDKNIRML